MAKAAGPPGNIPAGDLDREIFIDVEPDVRVRYRRTESPPPWRYAVILEILVEGTWATIHLWDNAHDPEIHQEHEETRREGKKGPIVLDFESVRDAMAAAVEKGVGQWREIKDRWEGS